ncbi:MAG TPA: permease-like cell division protein FtsX [Solirubrobacteraceae bacterium]|nr:permease-like cell division protein FtsX [Solirubrobacteraceae bacterium]
MRPGFFLKESFRSIRHNAVPSFAAFASVLVTTLVLGVFIPVVQATNGAANDVRGRVLVDVDLSTSATPAEEARVRGELGRAPHVKSVQFVSRQTGYEQERKLNPQAFALIGYNPLPDIFRVTPASPEDAGAVRAELDQSSPLGTRLVTDPAIAAVQDRQAETNRILSATRVIKLTMALLAALLVIASVLLISNTIRLSLFSRRREVEVMKLVGATDWFIRWPFVLEGLFLGALGGGAAIGLLALAKVTLVDPLANTVKLISQPDMIAFPALIAILMACAVAVSAAGSGLSLRRFLRV